MSMGGGQQQGAPQLQQSQTGGNTSQQGTTTTNTGPWAAQQPFVQGGFSNAQNLLNAGSNLQTSPLLQSSWTDMTGAANAGQGNNAGTQGYINNVLNGGFLSPNSNPYLAQSVQAAEQPILANYQTAIAPGVASNSEMNNRYGSGSANQQMNQANTALLNNLSNTSANMYNSAYNTGIGQMNSAANLQPSLTNSSLAASSLLNQAGQQQQSQMNLAQQYPWLTAQQYQGIVGGNYGTSGTTNMNQTGTSQGTMTGQASQPYYSNPAGSIFGGALAGLGTAGQLGFSPFGAGGLFGGAGAAAGGGVGIADLAALPAAFV